jgi:hypothetical protein
MNFCRKVSSVSDALRCLSLSAVARGVETPSSHLSAVKRPANSYVIFKTEKLKTIPTMSLADSNKELGKQWKQLTPAEKRHYQAVCWGFGTGSGSACFWASRIRILPFSHKCVEQIEKMPEK